MTALRATLPAEDQGLRLRLLGGFAAWLGGRPVDLGAWRRRKSRAVVKLLALAPGHRLHREQVIEALWPDVAVRDGANNLHYVMHLARRALSGGELAGQVDLRINGGVVALACPGGIETDAALFEGAARRALGSGAVAALDAAAALYAGELLPEDPYEDWSAAPRERLRDLYLSVLLELSECYERARRPAKAIDALQRAIAADPLHEGAHRALVRLYAASGRRAEARRHYRQFATRLDTEYQSEPPAARRGARELTAGPLPDSPQGRHAIPAPLTRFVGRERELALLARAQRRARLVTLSGTGGTGKTRLALEGAARAAAQYTGGVWMAELAPVASSDVPAVVAAAVGVPNTGSWPIQDVLRRRLSALAGPALLVLDNCEHALEGCAALASALLPHCPSLTIVATSRRPLGVLGETVLRVPPLSLPGDAGGSAAAPRVLRDSEAVQLFEDRARLAAPAFRLTRETARSVAQIVRRLDGLPLAIELAAARVAALSVSEIAARLEESASRSGEGRFAQLNAGTRGAPARHRSLRALFDWTYHALPADERRLFRRLAVFAGGFTLDAAGAVCAEGHDAAGPLAALVENSLATLAPSSRGEVRYRLLETLRAYAAACLEREESAEAHERLYRRHVVYFGDHVAASEARSAAAGGNLDVIARELENCRSALRWAIQHVQPEIGLRLALQLSPYWHARGSPAEGLACFESLLAHCKVDAHELDGSLHAEALRCVASLARVVGELQKARTYQERYIELLRRQGNRPAIAAACLWLSVIAQTQGDDDGARTAMDECLRRARAMGDSILIESALPYRALLALGQGELAAARSFLENSLAVFRGRGEWESEAGVLAQLGHVSLWRRDFSKAREQLQDSLALCRQSPSRRGIAGVLVHLAWLDYGEGDHRRGLAGLRHAISLGRDLGVRQVLLQGLERLGAIAFRTGQVRRAAWLLGAAEVLRAELPGILGITPTPADLRLPTRKSLAARGCALTWRQAATLPLDRVVDLALSDQV